MGTDALRHQPAPVLHSLQGGVGQVVLNRPEKLNAITVELGAELAAALEEVARHASVAVVRGAGGNFSVGGDFEEVARLRAQGPEALRPLFENFGRACSLIAELPVPVVAVVEGYALAGGFELMQACDIAVVRDDATLADQHLAHGQTPGGGGSQRLPRLVGRQRALGHILTGDRLTGAEAAAWGLAYRSAPADRFEGVVSELVQRLGSRDRAAVRRTKRLVYQGLSRPLAEGLALERETVLRHLAGDAAGRGIDALAAGRRTAQ